MFFWLSKIFWFLFHPINLLFLGICAVAILLMMKWLRSARFLAVGMALGSLLIATVPIGDYVLVQLEDRFPANPKLPPKIDGIVVLGGVISAVLSQARKAPQVGSSIERISEVTTLLAHSPNAKVIFTGGSGDPLNPEKREAHYAPDVFRWFSIDPNRVVFEDRSRNTAENAELTFDLAKPKPGEHWVLVTSAFHMPRSVGAFRKAGWRIIPYPVDYTTSGRDPWRFSFSFRSNLGAFASGLHECLGLLFYWLTDRTDALFPGPEQ